MNNDENTNKTTWIKKKKNVFSDSSNNIDENFQVLNMKQKVMNAFKKKKARALHQENYKNIELLENIYDISGNEPSNQKDVPEKDVPEKPVVIENFKDSDHDGIDKPDPKRKKDGFKNPLLDFFNDIFERIDKFNYNKAKLLAQVLSKRTNSESDILLIKYYIALFETIGFSYFAAYNWFYFMFYCEELPSETPTGTPIVQHGGVGLSGMSSGLSGMTSKLGSMGNGMRSGLGGMSAGLSNGMSSGLDSMKQKMSNQMNHLRERFNSNKNNCRRPQQPEFSKRKQIEISKSVTLMDLYTIFCEYFIIFTEYFQSFMLLIVPAIWSPFNRKTSFILLFLCFIYLIFICARPINNLIIDACNMKIKNFNVFLLLVVIFFSYIPTPWFPAKDTSEEEELKASQKMEIVMKSLYILVPFLIFRCIRAFMIFYLTIPFGVTMVLAYFMYYSLFGIFGNKWFNPLKTYEAFKELYIYMKKGETHPQIKPSEDLSFMQKFMVVFNNFCDSLHRYILYIVYIIMFLVAMVDYYNKINSIKLKTNLLIISFALILIFGSLCVAGFMTHGLSEANNISSTVGEAVNKVVASSVTPDIVTGEKEKTDIIDRVTSAITNLTSTDKTGVSQPVSGGSVA
jgi:hypothetical protein